MEENLTLKKAELILGGGVRLPEGFVMPTRISNSTAGPGAGHGSAVFSFGGYRVKKSISYSDGEFMLSGADGKYTLSRNGETFLDNVRIDPVAFHCPEQAFFNLDPRCMFNCAFCNSPMLEHDASRRLSDTQIVSKI